MALDTFDTGRVWYRCPFRSLAAAKRENRRIGHHWFDADAVRHFDAKTHTEPDRLGLFVGSIRPPAWSDGTRDARTYAVYQVLPTGAVETVSGPPSDGFKSKADAVRHMEAIRDAFEVFSADPALLGAIASAPAADRGHFSDTVFVNGPTMHSGLGPVSLWQFQRDRIGTADGAQTNGAVYHKGALVAYMDTRGARVRR